jgi:hypothetical protein
MEYLITESQLKVIVNEQSMGGGFSPQFQTSELSNVIYPKPDMRKGFQQLVSVLSNSRSSGWGSGAAKTLFNSSRDLVDVATTLITWALKNRSYDPKILKAALTTLFRESKASPSMVFAQPKEILGFLSNIFGGDHSQGFAQIKPSTAKRYNISMKSLYTYAGSLDAAYKMVMNDYLNAQKYYNGSIVTVFENGKLVQKPAIGNDAALHMAIASHNAGSGIIGDWCETNIKNIANKCNVKSRTPDKNNKNIVAITNPNKKILNYFPNIGGVHKYMPQFKKYYNSLSGVPNLINTINAANTPPKKTVKK